MVPRLLLLCFQVIIVCPTIEAVSDIIKTTQHKKKREQQQYKMTAAAFLEPAEDHVEVEAMPMDDDVVDNNISSRSGEPVLPEWVEKRRSSWGEKLVVQEWEQDDGTYRSKHGWKGHDLIHDRNSPVRVLDYYVKYGTGSGIACDSYKKGGIGTTLTGIAHFTERAESHQGLCHGGSMTSLLDDVIGWVGFLVTGSCKPWSGYTVQINSKLQNPIRVNSMLMVQATIKNIVRRKISIIATIVDPTKIITADNDTNDNDDDNNSSNDDLTGCTIHASGEGLVIINRGVLPEDSK